MILNAGGSFSVSGEGMNGSFTSCTSTLPPSPSVAGGGGRLSGVGSWITISGTDTVLFGVVAGVPDLTRLLGVDVDGDGDGDS